MKCILWIQCMHAMALWQFKQTVRLTQTVHLLHGECDSSSRQWYLPLAQLVPLLHGECDSSSRQWYLPLAQPVPLLHGEWQFKYSGTYPWHSLSLCYLVSEKVQADIGTYPWHSPSLCYMVWQFKQTLVLTPGTACPSATWWGSSNRHWYLPLAKPVLLLHGETVQADIGTYPWHSLSFCYMVRQLKKTMVLTPGTACPSATWWDSSSRYWYLPLALPTPLLHGVTVQADIRTYPWHSLSFCYMVRQCWHDHCAVYGGW